MSSASGAGSRPATSHSPREILKAHLSLARISNTPTVVSNVLAGVVMAHALALDWITIWLCIAVALFYTAGMYLNDILDIGIDRQQRPDRPIPSGAVPLPVAWLTTIAMIVVGLALLLPGGGASFVAGIVLVAAIFLYDAWHKGNPVGPFIMGATRALVYVTAFLAFSHDWTWEATLWSVVLLLYTAGLTSIAKTEHGPAATRYWPLVCLALPVILALARSQNAGVIILAIVFVAWAIYCCTFVYIKERRSIGGAIARLIAGISLVDALVLATHDAWWGVAIAIVAFGATIFLQRWIRGT
ncbi:MAG TPA: UbiA family prenyltransferase [Thermomicrobiales bacterium]|nr:UbiA family prenyltransferase [Thermomicrobiales bacterium]